MAHSHGDGMGEWMQCHWLSPTSKLQQQTVFSVVLVVLGGTVAVVSVVLVIVVVVVVERSAFRQTHVPLGRARQVATSPDRHASNPAHSAPSMQSGQTHIPATSHPNGRIVCNPRRHHLGQSALVWQRPRGRPCRVQTPCRPSAPRLIRVRRRSAECVEADVRQVLGHRPEPRGERGILRP